VPVLALVVTAESLHLLLLPYVDPGTAPVAVAAYQPVPLATMLAAYTVAALRRPRVGWTAGLTAAAVLLVVSLIARPVRLLGTDMVMVDLILIATAVGAAIGYRRSRWAQLAREHEAEVRNRVLDERLRIARELHDVLTHRLTLVNAQAGVAEYLLATDPPTAGTALHDIATNTRAALDELRATVGLLRTHPEDRADDQEDDTGPEARRPLPGIEQLGELIAGFRAAGAAVDVTVEGQPDGLTAGGELAVYRIVQEALTNATKHAPGSATTVALQWAPDGLGVTVTNGPPSASQHGRQPSGAGLGLVGMRERALATGGHLTAGRRPDGGFVIAAFIPTGNAGERRRETAPGAESEGRRTLP
jgi:signal transduction histidine kinase